MSRLNWSLVVAVVGLSFALETGSALAQGRGRQQPQMPRGEPINRGAPVKGTIEAIQFPMLKVNCGGESTMVKFGPNPIFSVTGTAEPDALMRGMCVKFSADLDKKTGMVKEPVKQMSICTQGRETMAAAAKPGEKPAPFAAEAAASDGYQGVIDSVKMKRLTLSVIGVKNKVKIELADGATINVSCADVSLARVGDTIEITGGQKYPQGVMANEGTISMAQPLGAKKPKIAPKAAHAKPGEDPMATDEKPKPSKLGKKPAKKDAEEPEK